MNDSISVKGSVTAVLTREDGSIEEYKTDNLVVNLGLARIASRLKDASAAVVSHMGVGTSTTAASGSQTSLISQLARVALTGTTIVTTTVSDDTISYVATFPAGTATGAITEIGLFDAVSAGTMISRAVLAVINKGSLDSLSFTWNIKIA